MAQVVSNPQEKRVYSNKLNKVVNVAEVRWYAFEFTNSEGRADVGLAAAFGKDPKDGKQFLAIIEPARLKELLTEPHPHIRDGIRAIIDVSNIAAPDLPVGDIGSADIDDDAPQDKGKKKEKVA